MNNTIENTTDYVTQLQACTRCAAAMSCVQVNPMESAQTLKPRPIVLNLMKKPVMLIGQAPGITEYESGRPFSGDAGQAVRKLFSEAGLGAESFDRLVHSSAVAKCFPGSRIARKGEKTRREDLKPGRQMIGNCQSFMEAEIRLVDPQVIVLLGKVPLEAYVQWKPAKAQSVNLENWVGRVDTWNGRKVIPLAHTSGLSTWLNDANHKAQQELAKRHLAASLAQLAR